MFKEAGHASGTTNLQTHIVNLVREIFDTVWEFLGVGDGRTSSTISSGSLPAFAQELYMQSDIIMKSLTVIHEDI